jgi:hypothetical protein
MVIHLSTLSRGAMTSRRRLLVAAGADVNAGVGDAGNATTWRSGKTTRSLWSCCAGWSGGYPSPSSGKRREEAAAMGGAVVKLF